MGAQVTSTHFLGIQIPNETNVIAKPIIIDKASNVGLIGVPAEISFQAGPKYRFAGCVENRIGIIRFQNGKSLQDIVKALYRI